MKVLPNILVMLFVLGTNPLSAQSSYSLSGGYKITIHGGSNLHDWDETAGKASGSSNISWNNDGSFDLNSLTLSVEVNSIKSSEGSIMNEKTYKALKAGKNPMITFMLTTPLKAVHSDAGGNTTIASGNLTIAGVTRPVVIHAKVEAGNRNRIVFEGSQEIKMSDYGIDPPTALFGALKVTDNVTIRFSTGFTANNM